MATITSSQPMSNYDPVAIVRIVEAEVSINNAKKALLKGAEKMPVKDRELFKQHIDSIAKKLFLELQQIRLTASSSKDWNAQIESSIRKLNARADDFRIFGKDHEANKARINDKLNEIDKRIAGSSIGEDDNFDISEPAHHTKTAREFMAEDPLWAHKQITIQGNMAAASAVASVVRGAATIAIEALSDMGKDVSNKVDMVCKFNSTTEKVCKAVPKLVASAATVTIDASTRILQHAADTAVCLPMAMPVGPQGMSWVQHTRRGEFKTGKNSVDQTGTPAATIASNAQTEEAEKLNGAALSEIYARDFLIPENDTHHYMTDVSTMANAATLVTPIGTIIKGAKAVAVKALQNTVKAVSEAKNVSAVKMPKSQTVSKEAVKKTETAASPPKKSLTLTESTGLTPRISAAVHRKPQREKWIISTLKADEAALTKGKNLRNFPSHFETQTFEQFKIGAAKNGMIKGKLIYMPMEKSGLFVMTRPRLFAGMENNVIRSHSLTREEHLQYLLKEIRHVAHDKGFEHIYITWSPNSFNFAHFLTDKNLLKLDKVFFINNGTNPLPVIKIAVTDLKI